MRIVATSCKIPGHPDQAARLTNDATTNFLFGAISMSVTAAVDAPACRIDMNIYSFVIQ